MEDVHFPVGLEWVRALPVEEAEVHHLRLIVNAMNAIAWSMEGFPSIQRAVGAISFKGRMAVFHGGEENRRGAPGQAWLASEGGRRYDRRIVDQITPPCL